MKVHLICLSLALLGSGCKTESKYAHDPRAFLVGPDYLDYIDEFPRDRDTQYYYPLFSSGGRTNWINPYHSLGEDASNPRIKVLEIVVPEPKEEVQAITGKGWPHLEQAGIPFSAIPSY